MGETTKADQAALRAAPKEQRATPRFKCSGTARIDAPGSHAGQPGTIRDLSLGGCLLELQKARDFVNGAAIELTIKAKGAVFRVRGTVTPRSTPTLIGIAFHTMSVRSHAELEELIDLLSSSLPVSNPLPVGSSLPAAVGLSAVSQESTQG